MNKDSYYYFFIFDNSQGGRITKYPSHSSPTRTPGGGVQVFKILKLHINFFFSKILYIFNILYNTLKKK